MRLPSRLDAYVQLEGEDMAHELYLYEPADKRCGPTLTEKDKD